MTEKALDDVKVRGYYATFERRIEEAKEKGSYREFLLAMARSLQYELYGNTEVRFAWSMEYLLRAIIQLLERESPDPNYVLNKIENGVQNLREKFKSQKKTGP